MRRAAAPSPAASPPLAPAAPAQFLRAPAAAGAAPASRPRAAVLLPAWRAGGAGAPRLELPSSPRGAAPARARPERHADRPFRSSPRRYESRRTDRVVGNRNRVTDQSRNF